MDTGFLGCGEANTVDSESELAKRTADPSVTGTYLEALNAARLDPQAFEKVYGELVADRLAKTPELVAIAKGYAGAGKKVGSKKAALDVIRKRFVELVRYEAKNEVAARSRPW